MDLSKQDMFCEGQQLDGTTLTAASTNVLDFSKHGDDILYRLFWSLFVDAATNGSALTVQWYTSDAENFSSETKLFEKSIAKELLTQGAYPIKDEPLPKGLKRYNRLKFTTEASKTAYPKVTAFLHSGRDAGTPYKG